MEGGFSSRRHLYGGCGQGEARSHPRRLFLLRKRFQTDRRLAGFHSKEREMPSINIAALTHQKGVAITARLKGPLNSPQLTFQSAPPLPLSAIMSYLLFGQDLSEISGFKLCSSRRRSRVLPDRGPTSWRARAAPRRSTCFASSQRPMATMAAA